MLAMIVLSQLHRAHLHVIRINPASLDDTAPRSSCDVKLHYWDHTLNDILGKANLKPSLTKPCLYKHHGASGKGVFVVFVHKNEQLLACSSACYSGLVKHLGHQPLELETKMAEGTIEHLGCSYAPSAQTYRRSLNRHVTLLLASWQEINQPYHQIPSGAYDRNPRTGLQANTVNLQVYGTTVTTLLWVAKTVQPEILWAVTNLAQSLHDPSDIHLDAADDLISCLLGTPYAMTMVPHRNAPALQLYTSAGVV